MHVCFRWNHVTQNQTSSPFPMPKWCKWIPSFSPSKEIVDLLQKSIYVHQFDGESFHRHKYHTEVNLKAIMGIISHWSGRAFPRLNESWVQNMKTKTRTRTRTTRRRAEAEAEAEAEAQEIVELFFIVYEAGVNESIHYSLIRVDLDASRSRNCLFRNYNVDSTWCNRGARETALNENSHTFCREQVNAT